MIEVGVVIAQDGTPWHWHLPAGRTSGSLPDSRGLWDVFWEQRHHLAGFAHSHPGSGWPGPSWTDLTTFAAIEAALGRRLDWWITSSDRLIVLRWVGPGRHQYDEELLFTEPEWVVQLRHLSETPTRG